MQGAVRFEKFRLPLPKYTANDHCPKSLALAFFPLFLYILERLDILEYFN